MVASHVVVASRCYVWLPIMGTAALEAHNVLMNLKISVHVIILIGKESD